jgi:hypothetical protein
METIMSTTPALSTPTLSPPAQQANASTNKYAAVVVCDAMSLQRLMDFLTLQTGAPDDCYHYSVMPLQTHMPHVTGVASNNLLPQE